MSAAQPHPTISLGIIDDGAGGLIFLLSDGRSLALHERLMLPAGGVSPWLGPDWHEAASQGQVAGFGASMAQSLLPFVVRDALGRQPLSVLRLQLSEALAAVPWELACWAQQGEEPAFLDDRFVVARQIMASGAASAPLAHRDAGAQVQVLVLDQPGVQPLMATPAPAGPAALNAPLQWQRHQHMPSQAGATAALHQAVAQADVLHLGSGLLHALGDGGHPAHPTRLAVLPCAPRLLLVEADAVLATQARAAHGWAMAASRCGFSALAQPLSPALSRVFFDGLAQGHSFGVAAQRVRASARAAGHAVGMGAWFYGDAQHQPVQADRRAAPPRVAAGAPPLSAAPAPHTGDDLRQVTILACDLIDSTGLMHRLGDEEYSERLTHYHQRVALIAQRHAGMADDPQGDDGFMCYFGYPVASEDAAAQALRAGLSLSAALDDLGLQVRIGISTGQVVIRNGQPVGSAVHHAARLQAMAGAGNVLVGGATQRIAGERFEFELVDAAARLKGFEDAGSVWRVVKERRAQGTERFDVRADLSPFIGRDAELAQLHQVWQQAVAGQRQMLLLQGEAGIGKSRLVREFRHAVLAQGRRILECRCAPELSGSAFAPLIDLLRRMMHLQESDTVAAQVTAVRALRLPGSDDNDMALLGALLSLPPEAMPPLPFAGQPERQREATLAMLVAWLHRTAIHKPVCLVVEDVHWIDPSTRAFIEQVQARAGAARLLVLLTLRSDRSAADEPPQPTKAWDVPVLRMGGLGADAACALLQGVCGDALLDAELARWLTARSDGVPLFIEESARMAAALAAQQPSTDITARLREAVPGTLRDLLMARLDQLPQAKRAAQVGSALGRAFAQALIEAVNAHEGSPIRLPALEQELAALAHAGLLTVQGEGDQRLYVFKHALVRDAAHQSLLERDRRPLHAAIAAVLQNQFPALCEHQPELLALHHEQAGMADQAVAEWERAARHAAKRSAHDEAITHLRRGLALVPRLTEGPTRDRAELRLQLLLASRLIATAGYGADQVESVYNRALALCELLDDQASLAKVRLGLEGYHFMRGNFERAHAMAQAVADRLGPDSEPLARIQSTWARANILFHQGHLPHAVGLMDVCLSDYLQLGHRPAAVQDPGVMCLCYSSWGLWEMGMADQSLQRARQVVELAEGLNHRFSIGEAYGFLAVSHYFRGETEAGLQAAQRAIEVCEAGGFAVWLAHAKVVHGRLLAEQGQLDRGLEQMRQGHAMWAGTGAVVTLPFYLVLRAEGLMLAHRHEEALALMHEAHGLITRHGERYYEPEVRRVTGELLLQHGRDAAEAEPWLQAGLACAQELKLRGLALKSALALGRLWAGQGRLTEAQGVVSTALTGLTEGLNTRDHRVARALLESWRLQGPRVL